MKANKILTPSEQVLNKRRAYARKYYKSHKKRARAYSKKNAEKIRLRAAQWRKDNRERYLYQQAMYDLIHRGKMHPEDRIRRAYNYLNTPRSNPDEKVDYSEDMGDDPDGDSDWRDG